MSSFARLALAVLVVLAALPSLAPAQQAKGKKYALLVGVKDYDHSSLTPLKYTENDVKEFARVLADKEAGFAEVVVLTATGGEKDEALKPTAKDIRAQLAKLSGKVKRHDLLIVGLAGHGLQFTVVDPRTKKERYESFFCPTDARPQAGRSFEELKKTMIPLGELFKELDDSGAGVRLMLVDACRNEASDSGSRSVDPDFLPKPAKGTAALFSCKSGEKAFESGKLKHGVFFYHVIQALKGEAKDRRGEVTWNGLADYVVNAVADKVPSLIGDGASQTPHEMKNIEGKSPVLLRLEKSKPAVEGKEAEKLYREADALFQGLGTTYDDRRALRLFRLAAEKGHPVADAMVGVMTYGGWGIEEDKKQAERIITARRSDIETAANKGDVIAERLMGLMYKTGVGVKRDYKEARKWFVKAAEQADALAMTNLANMYDEGQGVKQDRAEALRWEKKAAEKGIPDATFSLGVKYAYGTGVEKDYQEAVKWYRLAADKGHDMAENNLGFMYREGLGVEKSDKDAVKWFRKSADRGNALGMTNLGFMLASGRGVQKDEKEAVRWYRKAADKGHADAMRNLGDVYASGRGVQKDRAEAIRWYRKAVAAGSKTAKARLDKLDNER